MTVIPNLFVIGAPKCGTTFFHDLLSQHPDIFMSREKELWHFNDYNHASLWADYLKNFEDGENFRYRGESCATYCQTTAFPHIPRAIHKFCPDARLILIVRDPVPRMPSVWSQNVSTGHFARLTHYACKMPLSYREAIFNYPPFLEASKYYATILDYLDYFQGNQLLVIYFEDLIVDAQNAASEAFRFLDLPDFKLDLASAQKNSRESKRPFVPGSEKLAEFIPTSIRHLVPDETRKALKGKLSKMVTPPLDDRDLTQDEWAEFREILTPEVIGLYEYTGRTDDPFGFFHNEQERHGASQMRHRQPRVG